MRAYRLTADREEGGHVRYHANQSDAAEHKRNLRGEGWKPGEIQIDQVDIPTDKAGLIEWINEHCST